jgi:thiamine pyridinylase
MRLCLLLLGALLAGACATTSAAPAGPRRVETPPQRRELTASLYPFVPDASGMYWRLERDFEAAHPEIDLKIVLNENYYDHRPDKAKGILFSNADVYEIDSVLLEDFITAKKIQPVDASDLTGASRFRPLAEQASRRGNVWYGVPHWMCGNFLFYRRDDARLQSATTLRALEQALGAMTPPGGLLIDLKGKSTLGEMYLDAALDDQGTLEAALPLLNPDKLSAENPSVAAIRRALALAPNGFSRDDDYHDRKGFYARQFARGAGRALVGYSERLYFIHEEKTQSCRKDEACLDLKNVAVREWPLSDRGSMPIVWVDVLAIGANATGQKQRDAEELIRFLVSSAAYRGILVPGWGESPRYLMPATSEMYSDPELLQAAPLYGELLPLLEKGVTVSRPGLNATLREMGRKLDEELLPAAP